MTTKVRSYAELVERVKELESKNSKNAMGQLEIARTFFRDLEQKLEPILGTERFDDPIELHNVRSSLRALGSVLSDVVAIAPGPYSEKRSG